MRNVAEVKRVVERVHGGKARLVRSVSVREEAEGKLIWQGPVYVFDVAGEKVSARVYAGTMPIEGTSERRTFSFLHTIKINSPLAAVRAAILMEERRSRPIL